MTQGTTVKVSITTFDGFLFVVEDASVRKAVAQVEAKGHAVMRWHIVRVAPATIPCGWCDELVIVSDDHGQVVYCSEAHERLNGYVPEAVGNL